MSCSSVPSPGASAASGGAATAVTAANSLIPTTVLLLGSGELGRELVISLKRLGAYVVACDSYPDAPAMQVSDESRVFPMTDGVALSKVIDEVKPQLVVPEIEQVAVDVLTQVAQRSDLHVVPHSAAVSATFDRRRIRDVAARIAGVPTSNYGFADSVEALRQVAGEIGYPCFVKPTMSSSGHGQSFVPNAEQIDQAWEEAQSGARATTNWVIVESQVEFDYEITLLTVRSLVNGEPCLAFCEPIGHRQVSGDYVESWQPQPMSPVAYERARQIAAAVVEALADQAPEEEMLGIFGVELFVAGDQVWFSEVSPRPHDTGMVTSVTQHQSEFDLHARAILGLPVDTTLVSPGASAVIKASCPDEIEQPTYRGLADALAVADDVRLFRKPVSRPGRRMGVALARGPIEEARDKAKRAAGMVLISDSPNR